MSCEGMDKRTKAYKECIEAQEEKEITGLGDVVERITEATGIKAAVKWLAGEDCGCDERKEKLNKLFPLKRQKPKCMTEEQHGQWSAMIEKYPRSTPARLPFQDREVISRLHADLFNYRFKKVSSCGSCILGYINDINKIYKTYEGDNKKE